MMVKGCIRQPGCRNKGAVAPAWCSLAPSLLPCMQHGRVGWTQQDNILHFNSADDSYRKQCNNVQGSTLSSRSCSSSSTRSLYLQCVDRGVYSKRAV